MNQNQSGSEKENLLQYMASRAAAQSFFMAHAVRAYQTAHQLDHTSLINWLGIEPEQLTRLELCRRPDPYGDKAQYLKGIATIAAKFGIDEFKLNLLLKAT